MKSPNYHYNLWNIISYFSGENIILTCFYVCCFNSCCFHSFNTLKMVNGSELNANSQQYSYHKQYDPYFLKVPQLIETMIGQTAILSCKVENLQDKMVFWIRSTDLQILTAGKDTFTSDDRITLNHANIFDNTDWSLVISNVKNEDNGTYECQINTEPKMKNYVKLIVKEPHIINMDSPYFGAAIDGSRVQAVKSNSTITLTCRVEINENQENSNNNNNKARRIEWFKDGELINLEIHRGGLSIQTEWFLYSASSKFTLSFVQLQDTGTYSCATTNPVYISDSIELNVINGEKMDLPYSTINNGFKSQINWFLYLIAVIFSVCYIK